MKDQIDQLVRGIMDDLAQLSPNASEVAVFLIRSSVFIVL